MNDFENLKTLEGKQFDYDDIICAMTDIDEEVIVSEIEGYTSNFEGYGICQLYNAYYNMENSIIYHIWVDKNNTIIYISYS